MVGYHVQATDGGIGKVSAVSHAANDSCLVVDTGPWIFGRKVLLPAGLIDRIDHVDRNVYVDCTKAQIKAAPDYDDSVRDDAAYRDKIAGYYGAPVDVYPSTGRTPMAQSPQ